MNHVVTHKTINDQEIKWITLTNDLDMEITLSTFGASIYNIKKNIDGEKQYLTLMPKDINEFLKVDDYHGKTIGRTSGRIKNAKFKINKNFYSLTKNDGKHNLHGAGVFSNRNFEYMIELADKFTRVIFNSSSKEQEHGFPAYMDIEVHYTFYKLKNEIEIDYYAYSNQPTICNLSNHTYFNLSGNLKDNILNHKLWIDADYCFNGKQLVAERLEKCNEVTSFKKEHLIKDYIDDDSLQNSSYKGYDHQYLLNKNEDNKCVAILSYGKSKLSLMIYTTYPCLTIYSNNYPTNLECYGDVNDSKYLSLCLEAQYVPNGINIKDQEFGYVNKMTPYHHKIKYSFVEEKE